MPWRPARAATSGAGGRKTYHNVYLLEFDGDGRCRSFTELFMEQR